MFCSMCSKAGRVGFDTHFVRASREPYAAITCPFLLAIECRYCKKSGHTKNYCPMLNEKITDSTKGKTNRLSATVDSSGFTAPNSRHRNRGKANKIEASVEVQLGHFAALQIDSDESDSDTICGEVADEYPELPSLSTKNWGASTLSSGAWGDC